MLARAPTGPPLGDGRDLWHSKAPQNASCLQLCLRAQAIQQAALGADQLLFPKERPLAVWAVQCSPEHPQEQQIEQVGRAPTKEVGDMSEWVGGCQRSSQGKGKRVSKVQKSKGTQELAASHCGFSVLRVTIA